MHGNTSLRTRLQHDATILTTIQAQQQDHPGYAEKTALAIVDRELRQLAAESRADRPQLNTRTALHITN